MTSTKQTLLSKLRGRSFSRTKARPFRPPREYTFADFNDELKSLRLAGRTYDITQYAQRLADRLGLVIKVVAFNDVDNPLLQSQMAYYEIGGGLFHEPSTSTVWIVVPTSLEMKAQVFLAYHELAHIAAGHPFKRPQVLNDQAPEQHLSKAYPKDFIKRSDGLYEPTRRLARQAIPDIGDAQSTLAQCENEADVRARYALKAGLYGEHIYYRDEFFFAFKDRGSFSPIRWPVSLRALIRKGRARA